jgi:hypothetical protein
MCPRAFVPLIALAVAALLAAALPASAQTAAIADPTQPAGAVTASLGTANARHARGAGEPAAPQAWPKLQSVQVGDNGSGSAMIDGRIIQVGDTVGALTLVAIDAQGVLLRGARFEQRLALLPGIEKTALAEPAAPQPAIARVTPAPATPARVRARATTLASMTASPAPAPTPAPTSSPIGLPLKLDLQIDTPAPDAASVAPDALAQAPTKEFR